MGKTMRKGSKEFNSEEQYEGQTKRDYNQAALRRKQRRLKEALRSKNLDDIEVVMGGRRGDDNNAH
jgi:hypothetical protein|tara:strand:- start:751 stop:948 length:198 start_codon:yes stop_codon:yes gene_type:complete